MYNKITLGNSNNSNNSITSYTELTDLPQVNGVTLQGNLSADDLSLAEKDTLAQVKEELEKKATQEEVDEVKTDVEIITQTLAKTIDTVDIVSNSLTTKADKADVDKVNTSVDEKVSSINEEISKKANKEDVQAVSTALSSKVDKVDVDKISTDLSTLNDAVSAQASKLEGKADKEELPTVATVEKLGLVKPDGTTVFITEDGTISAVGGSAEGTTNYLELVNKPQVNGVELSGNKTASDLGLAAASDLEDKATKAEVTNLQNTVNTKADKTSVDEISEILVTKASKTELPTVATRENAGLVKPDNSTITVTEDGTISAVYEANDTINQLTYAATVALQDNKIYSIVLGGNIVFTLPSITDTTKLHQILVQLRMPNVYSVDLGTTNFFKGVAPDLSVTGYYNLVYEYDVNGNNWVVDAVIKAQEDGTFSITDELDYTDK